MAQTPYEEQGFRDRNDYIRNLAEDYGVPVDHLQALAHVLGPEEDFDGLVVAAQDYGDDMS